MSAFQNRSKASLRASLIDGTTTAISQRDGQSNRFIIAQHVHDAFWQISLPSLRTTSTWNGQILCLLRTGTARQQILPFLWELKRGHLQKQLYFLDLYSWIAFIFSRHAVCWCCSGNRCWLACVLCCGYCSMSSQCFVIRHLAIATVRNSEKQFKYFICVSLPFSAECLANFSLKAVSSLDS